MKEKYSKLIPIFFLIAFLGSFASFIFDITSSQIHYVRQRSDTSQKNSKELIKEFTGKAHVVDGDSIKVFDGNKIKEARLVGIDAPEYKQTCFDEKDVEYNCGKESTKFLTELANNKKITCYYTQKDIYNRYLAKCKIGEISINQEILKNGMAIIYDYSQSNKLMKELEKSASNSKLGIWRGKFQIPKAYRKSHRHKK